MFDWIRNLTRGGSDGCRGCGATASVPEIDASTGLMAMAAVAVALLFAWERRRRMNRNG